MMLRVIISLFLLCCIKESYSAGIDGDCTTDADCEKADSGCYSGKCKCKFPKAYDTTAANCTGTPQFCSNDRDCAFGTCVSNVCKCDGGYTSESNCRLRQYSSGVSIKPGVTSLVLLIGSVWMLLK
ncbi:tenascin-like [Saccostrea echinata]|uniref:tenascin-like n=1 Tax=Saccostrea echinata TaxID=191078 RepID=UPI002A83A591|nr:tenascin-like [Saccostrea echinata]